jgi:hypothetical protein
MGPTATGGNIFVEEFPKFTFEYKFDVLSDFA